MAFFKLRKGGEERTTPSAVAPESAEAMRKRARHRLIGAAVLVLIGVIGFPMLFDNQPRPIPVDLPINIPDKNTVKPLGNLPVGNAALAAAGTPMIDEAAEPALPTLQPTKPPTLAAPAPAASRQAAGNLAGVAPALAAKPVVKTLEKPADKLADQSKTALAKADSGVKAQSLLEGKESFVPTIPATSVPNTAASAPAVGARFVVQVGAFSDAAKAHEARVRLESAGLKTYTQIVNPIEGKRIRVRVGPFESKADADKVAAKVKKLDLPAAILEL